MSFDNEKSILVKSIDKNKRGDKILINKLEDASSGEFVAIDIRQYYIDDSDELRPTRKGVRVPASLFNELVEAINSVNKEE